MKLPIFYSILSTVLITQAAIAYDHSYKFTNAYRDDSCKQSIDNLLSPYQPGEAQRAIILSSYCHPNTKEQDRALKYYLKGVKQSAPKTIRIIGVGSLRAGIARDLRGEIISIATMEDMISIIIAERSCIARFPTATQEQINRCMADY